MDGASFSPFGSSGSTLASYLGLPLAELGYLAQIRVCGFGFFDPKGKEAVHNSKGGPPSLSSPFPRGKEGVRKKGDSRACGGFACC